MADTTPAPKPVEFIDLLLAGAIVIALIGGGLILALVSIPDNRLVPFVGLLTGTVGAAFGALVNNRWGSSKGSEAKTEALTNMAIRPDTATPDLIAALKENTEATKAAN